MRRVPGYRLHKASGQAVVVLSGRSYYLGAYGSPESRKLYERRIAEWLQHKQAPPEVANVRGLSVSEVILAYLRSIEGRYSPKQDDRIKRSLALVRRLYGDARVDSFGGRALKTVRAEMVRQGLVRRHINHRVGTIKAWVRWALSEEMFPPEPAQSALAVVGLRRGEVDAPESRTVEAVPLERVQAALAYLSPVVGAMVQVQLAAGMRPGEVCAIRVEEIDQEQAGLWVWRPARHKTAHHNHGRQVFLGPQAIAVLKQHLPPAGYVFSPRRAMQGHWEALRAARQSKVQPSQRCRRVAAPRRVPGECYLVSSYAHAIARACQRAGIPRWHPHQLRHTAATVMAQQHGWEVARIFLGHRSLDVTRIYAEDDLARVMEVVRRLG